MKRLFDIFFSGIGCILLLPVFIAIAVCIKFDSRGPIFFRQVRVGLQGENFLIHKFRSMYINSESKGRLTVGADTRITKVGGVIRKYKLDELPQLIDVFVGKMSLVGPRPEVPEYIRCYPDDVRDKVLSVRPGITDNASLEMIDENDVLSNYKDPRSAYIEIILPLKQKYYLEYVANNSLWVDIKIIIKTLLKIFSRK